METKTAFQLRVEEENRILKSIERGILKSAKKGDLHYYWDVTGLSDFMIKSIISKLETEGRMVKFKSANFRIVRW